MNVTFSADRDLIVKARRYAVMHNTTLNRLFRDYLKQLVGDMSFGEAAEEFRQISLNMGGRSPEGWKLNRTTIHRHEENE